MSLGTEDCEFCPLESFKPTKLSFRDGLQLGSLALFPLLPLSLWALKCWYAGNGLGSEWRRGRKEDAEWWAPLYLHKPFDVDKFTPPPSTTTITLRPLPSHPFQLWDRVQARDTKPSNNGATETVAQRWAAWLWLSRHMRASRSHDWMHHTSGNTRLRSSAVMRCHQLIVSDRKPKHCELFIFIHQRGFKDKLI